MRGIGTYLINTDNFTDPVNPQVPNRQKSELGSPEFAANATATYDFGPATISYTLRYTGKQTIGAYETQNSYTGLCTQGAVNTSACSAGDLNKLVTLPPQNADAFPFIYYPEAFIHNARISIDIDRKSSFYIGMDNLFDTAPKFGLLGIESGSPVNSIGRFFYAGITAGF